MTITRYSMAEDIGGRNMHPSPTGEFVLHSALTEIERAAYERGVLDAAEKADFYANADYCAMGYPEDGGIAASGTARMIHRDILALLTQEGR